MSDLPEELKRQLAQPSDVLDYSGYVPDPRETIGEEDVPFVAEWIARILKAEQMHDRALKSRDFAETRRLKLTYKTETLSLQQWLANKNYGGYRSLRGTVGEYIVKSTGGRTLVFTIDQSRARLTFE